MEEYLGIYDVDCAYSSALTNALAGKRGLPEIVEFSAPGMISTFSQKRKLVMLLANEELSNAAPQGCSFIALTEEKKGGGIFKYQPASVTAAELAQEYERIQRSRGQISDTGRIFGVYSPLGGVQKTMIGLCLSAVLAQSGSTLFISLDEFGTISAILGSPQASLSDVIYYYLQGELEQKVTELITRHRGFDYIAQAVSPEDVRRLAPAQLSELLCTLLFAGQYKYTVIDIGNAVSDTRPVMEMCENVFMPQKNDMLSRCKCTAFLSWMENTSPEICKRIKSVGPLSQTIPEGAGPEDLRAAVFKGELYDYVGSMISGCV